MTQRPFFGAGAATGETPEEKQARIFRAFKPWSRRLPGFEFPFPTDVLTESQRQAISREEAGIDFMPGYENIPTGVLPSLFEKRKRIEREEIPGFPRYTLEESGQYAGKDRPLTPGELAVYDIRGELYDPITKQPQVPIPYDYRPKKLTNVLGTMGGTWISGFEEGARWLRGKSEKGLRFATGDEKGRYEEALRKHEAAIGRELDTFEEQEFFDKTFTDLKWLPDQYTRGTAELLIEIAVPANMIEKAGEKIAMKGLKPLYKYGIKPVWKGGTQYLPGIGQIVDFVTPEVVQKMFARKINLKKVSTHELVEWYRHTLPLKDSTAWERMVLESPDGTISPEDIQRSNIDVHISRTVPRGGADFSNLTPAEREALLKEINDASAATEKELDEILTELKRRDIIGEEFVADAETGKSFTAYLFHGSGRSNMEAAYSDWGTREAILGDGLYTSSYREFAEGFGPNLEVIPVELRNPLVVDTDNAWTTLTKRAGLFSHMPSSADEIVALRNVIIESGYDGLVIRVPEDEIIGKRLQQAFSFDTVVKLDDPRLLDETLDVVDVAKVHDLIKDRTYTGNWITVRDIAYKLGLPEAHVTRILEDLQQKGLAGSAGLGKGGKLGWWGTAREGGEEGITEVVDTSSALKNITEGFVSATPRNKWVQGQDALPDVIARISRSMGRGDESGLLGHELTDSQMDELRDYIQKYGFTGTSDDVGTTGFNISGLIDETYGGGLQMYISRIPFSPIVKGQDSFIVFNPVTNRFAIHGTSPDARSLKRLKEFAGTPQFKQRYGEPHPEAIQTLKRLGILEDVPEEAVSAIPPRVTGEVPTVPVERTLGEQLGDAVDPPGVPEKLSREAAEAPINSTPAKDPVVTVTARRSTPDASDIDIPPDRRTPVEAMWADQPRKSFGEKWQDFYRRMQNMMNDTYYNLRVMQGLVEKTRIIESGDEWDLITMLTNAPGAATAGQARLLRVMHEIKGISPNIMPDDLNSLLFVFRQKEMLGLYPKRKLPNGMTEKNLDDTLAMLRARLSPERFRELEAASDVVLRTYREERERLVKTGVISREVADKLAAQHPYYNPTHYVEYASREMARGKSTKSFSVFSNNIVKLSEHGSEKVVQKPLETLAEQLIRNEALIVRNDIAKTIIKLADAVSMPGVRRIIPRATEKIGSRRTLQFFDEGKQYIYEIPEWMKQETDYLTRGWGTDLVSSIVGAVNGISRAAFTAMSPVFIPVNIMADTVTAYMTRAHLPHRSAVRLLQSFRSIENDPVALTHRILRGNQAKYYGSEGRSLAEAAGIFPGMPEDEMANALSKKLANTFLYEGKPIGKRPLSKILKNALGSIGTFGDMAEQAPRQAFFKRQLDKALGKYEVVQSGADRTKNQINLEDALKIYQAKKQLPLLGGRIFGKEPKVGSTLGWEKVFTPEEVAMMPVARKAAADSIELTLNFARGGYLIKSANPFVLFLNASMEGIKMPIRALRREPGKFTMRLAGVTLGQASLTAYNLSYPEYMDIRKEDRWGSVLVMLPPVEKSKITGRWKPNYFTLIPATRDWSLFLGGTTYAMEQAFRDSPESLMDFMTATGENMTPFFDLPMPVVVEEATQQLANYDFFRDTNIVPPEIQQEETKKQVMPWTSRTMKEIGETFGISPIRTEHAFIGTLGGAGRVGLSVTDAIINKIDPEMVSPETAELVARYEEIEGSAERKNFIATLDPEQRDTLFFELRKPDPQIPVVGPIIKRFRPERGGGLRDAWEKEASKKTGIDIEETREVYSVLRDIGEEHLTIQQGMDKRLLVRDPGAFGPKEWVRGRGDLGIRYQGALEATSGMRGAAQHADPEVRQEYYDMVTKLGGEAPDDYVRGKTLASGWYSISLNEPTKSMSGVNLSRTLIPAPDDWERFRADQDKYMKNLSEEDRLILESEITAGYTPLEKEYYEDRKQIHEYYDMSVNAFKSGELVDFLTAFEIPLKKAKDDYNNFKRSGDPEGARNLYPFASTTIDSKISDMMRDAREDNYELEKILYKWGVITSPINPLLKLEVHNLRRALGGEVTNPLMIDSEMMQRIAPELVIPQTILSNIPEPVGAR